MADSRTSLALQMISQLRVLDPSVSADLGTPERKIIDTVAQSIYDNQVDLDALSQGLNVDGKYGAALTRFLALFGFTRQQPTYAGGFVTFSRLTSSNNDIRIPANTGVRAQSFGNVDGIDDIRFVTTYDVILPAGLTSIVAPIRCTVSGAIGNLAAGRINQAAGSTIFGITGITNEFATVGGIDAESDEELKVRFKNTVFRNLAGTRDQYLALAIATAFTTRVNVIGPVSNYQEYIQVPFVDDTQPYDVNGDAIPETSTGNAGSYTSALSSIPYAKSYWDQNPVFVSSGINQATSVFYRQNSDFTFNLTDRNHGDTARQFNGGVGPNPATTDYPNVTFTNVYAGDDPSVSAVTPGEIVLFEYSYLSEASRNDPVLHIGNAVDVYLDGGNEQIASMVTVRPNTSTAFVDNSNSKYHFENYRRIGEPAKRPIIGNVLMPTFWQPVISVPDQIVVGETTYLVNVHYWPVCDVSDIGGTIRSRGGIEWSTKVFGVSINDALNEELTYTGPIITDPTDDPVGGAVVEIESYTYDKNIVDLQTAYEGARQITTDVLAHKAKVRYFKLDITVMYTPGASVPSANSEIQDAVNNYLTSLYYGSTVQLSDMLQAVHNVQAVDNVRWTTDTPNSSDLVRVYETNEDGIPLASVSVERTQPGNLTRPEIQELFITGAPTSGTFSLRYDNTVIPNLPYNISAAALEAAIDPFHAVTVVEILRSTTDARSPVRSFRITWNANGVKVPFLPESFFVGGPYILNTDFFLRDNEIAQLATNSYTPPTAIADTIAGLIIRPRAQNTFLTR